MSTLLIQGGTIIDGSGNERFTGDLLVENGIIKSVSKKKITSHANRKINADGLLVTPGWVDIHTHYDGQITWDKYVTPSSWHGVSTVVMGNCGVGFAPVKKNNENFLIKLMEGVEDIPETVLAEGVDFNWETFPEYINHLNSLSRTLDFGVLVPHIPVRFFAMGLKGADFNSQPTNDEISLMKQIVSESLASGALGFSTSRTKKHTTKDGNYVSSLNAGKDELLGIFSAMKNYTNSLVEVNSDFADSDFEFIANIALKYNLPLSVLLLQVHNAPQRWNETLSKIKEFKAKGLTVNGQVGSRPIGMLMSFDGSINPFINSPTFKLINEMPSKEKKENLLLNDVKLKIIADTPKDDHLDWINSLLPRCFKFEDNFNYEPKEIQNILSISRQLNKPPLEVAYDWMLEKNCERMIYHAFENYNEYNLDVVRTLLADEDTICGLGDGGAHVGYLCDSSSVTSMLKYLKSDLSDQNLSIEYLIKKQTKETAHFFGLNDRGVLLQGMKADVNLIDFDNLDVTYPSIAHDLPAGGKRVIQKSKGYYKTFVSGVEVYNEFGFTENFPGRLIKGNQKN